MLRSLATALLSVLLATPVWAGDWQTAGGGACNALSLRSANHQCCQALIESDLTDLSPLNVRGFIISVRMSSGASVNLYAGGGTVATSSPLRWDTNGDGIPDNQTLDGSTAGKVGLSAVSVAGNLVVDPVSHSSNALLEACAVSQ